MQNIVRLTPSQILNLAERLTYADLHGKSVRIQTGTDSEGTFIEWDTGAGWVGRMRGEDY